MPGKGEPRKPGGYTPEDLKTRHDSAERLGCRLRDRVLTSVFPTLALGFLADREQRLGQVQPPSEAELAEIFSGTLILLYRLLFLALAESRKLLPVHEAAYHAVSLRRIQVEVAEQAGPAASEAAARLAGAYSPTSTRLHNRLGRLFQAVNRGDPALGLPPIGGGILDSTEPEDPSPGGFFECHKVPDRYLAVAIDLLARHRDEHLLALVFTDYGLLGVRLLGAIYEGLLQCELNRAETDLSGRILAASGGSGKRGPVQAADRRLFASKNQVFFVNGRSKRKACGAFYTPDFIVKYIVAHTVGPVLARKLERLASESGNAGEPLANGLFESLFDFKVIDPAMGSGHFLVEAANFITDRLLQFLRQHPQNPAAIAFNRTRTAGINALAEQGISRHPANAADRLLLKREVLTRCIHGVDSDPVSVQLARIGLWLDAGAAGLPLGLLADHLRYGNSLTEPELGEFDCVIGNPPYGARLDKATRRRIKAVLPLTQTNSDTAMAFLELGMKSLAAEGRLGLIMPKPLTYSYRWREARKFLGKRLRTLADISRAWPEVLLEQVVIVAGKKPRGTGYNRQTLAGGKFSKPRAISWRWVRRYETFPCALTDRELQLLQRLEAVSKRESGCQTCLPPGRSGDRPHVGKPGVDLQPLNLGDICKTFRGLGLQRSLRRSGGIPVVGGRDLERWRIRSFSGWVRGVDDEVLKRFQRPKLVFQNIIAHIARPHAHIALIGAYDPNHTVTLDTVNNIVPRLPQISLLAVLALLHSDFINWFVYAVVYNKAIRTMHFDQYFLNKIPLPASFEKLQKELGRLAEQCTGPEGGQDRLSRQGRRARQRINELVVAAYGAEGFDDIRSTNNDAPLQAV
jgi:N-6 DNA Methylase